MDLFQMSLSASVLILAIILIRACTLHFLPKRTFLVLWVVAALRLLVPYSFSSRINFFSLLPTFKTANLSEALQTVTVTQISMQTSEVIPVATPGLSSTISTSVSPSANNFSGYVWLWFIGFSVFALFFLFLHWKNRREFNTSLPLIHPKTECWLYEHMLRRPLQIRYLDCISVPLTYGVVRPVILLPKDAPLEDDEQLQYILLHEYVHIRRFDAIWKVFLAFLLCVHWFNPLVWCMYILANRDIELSCDEAVVHTLGHEKKEEYAMTLINLAASPCSSAPLINHFNKNVMEGRIKAIMKTKKIRLMSIILATVIVLGVTILFATLPKRSETPDYPTVRVEDKTTILQWMDNQQRLIHMYSMQYNGSQMMIESLNEIEVSIDKLELTSTEELQDIKVKINLLKEESRLLLSSYNHFLNDLQGYADTHNTAELDFYKDIVLPQLIQNDVITEEAAEETLTALEEVLNSEPLNLGNLPTQIKAQLEKTAEYYSFYSFSFYNSENPDDPYYTMFYFVVHRK
ncbi:MAG: M56 family metallopeptidase [Firmicutes bacterium]|nr:M56 family metallopeptidase [Bacillota bacterium]